MSAGGTPLSNPKDRSALLLERHSWKYEYLAFNLFSKQAAVKIL